MSDFSSMPIGVDLAQLRTQAKELLQAVQASSPEAVTRFRAHHPRFPIASPKLTDAQLVLARELGYPSWPKLVAAARTATMGAADAFVEAAIVGKLDRAQALLNDRPNLTQATIYTACVYGDVDALRRCLENDRGLANAVGGPRKRPPLLYAAFSRIFHVVERRPHLLETVKMLLSAGADPNAAYREAPWEDSPLPALYGAVGVLNDAELAGILLDAGANLNDNESLYHSCDHVANDCTELLLRRGADPNSVNALAHQLDSEDPEGLRLFLSHGADPNRSAPTGGNALHWAILRRRSVECIGLLLEYGADVEAQSAEGVTPYRMAVRSGQRETAALLEAHGADTALKAEDHIIGALASGDASQLKTVKTNHPEALTEALAQHGALLAEMAGDGRTDAVRLLLDLGVSPDTRGAHHGTALHWASWQARPDVVRLLTERGASLEIMGANFGATPLQWAIHGADNNPERPWETFVETFQALMEAGAALDPSWLEEASEKVRVAFISFSSSSVII
ncbi:MAG: ankyrin repeat domain-containing protein [Capsulimonas sp.]|uniref:ankyrin repeat domain-containing protein n=1 Tax=Capsulimonas sp. TaxID=2494211 RepID=UPI003262E422